VASLASAALDSNIIALNQSGGSPAPFGDAEDPLQPGQDVYGDISSNGYNLIGKVDGSATWQMKDQTGSIDVPLNPMLNSLADNGGPVIGYPDPDPMYQPKHVKTHEVQPFSPALQAGNPVTSPLTDERGVNRVQWQPNVGAYEATLDHFLVRQVGSGLIYT